MGLTVWKTRVISVMIDSYFFDHSSIELFCSHYHVENSCSWLYSRAGLILTKLKTNLLLINFFVCSRRQKFSFYLIFSHLVIWDAHFSISKSFSNSFLISLSFESLKTFYILSNLIALYTLILTKLQFFLLFLIYIKNIWFHWITN